MSLNLDNLDPKDPNDVVDYTVRWSRYLDRIGDTIQSSSWPVIDSGLSLQTHSFNALNGTATAWFTGGTAGTQYRATNRIITTGGRQRDKTITIRVRDL